MFGKKYISQDSFFLFFIFIINLIVFFPSFFHIARADQIKYLTELAPHETLSSIIEVSYSYTRTRLIGVGDQELFRPILYLLLSVEKYFFHCNFIYWQVTSFILHLFVLIQIFRVMKLFRFGLFSFLMLLNVSVLFISEEMVIWHHLSGYLLFSILLLEIFYQLVVFLKEDHIKEQRILWIAFYFLLANFTYEFGLICNAIFISVIYIACRNKVRKSPDVNNGFSFFPWGFILATPAILYLLVNFWDYTQKVGFHFQIGHTGKLDFPQLWENLLVAGGILLKGLTMPAFLEMIPQERSKIAFSFIHGVFDGYRIGSFTQNLNLVFLALWGLASTRFVCLSLKGQKDLELQEDPRNNFLLKMGMTVCVSMVFSYFLMIVFGRINKGDFRIEYLLQSTYHYYIPVIFLTLMLVMLNRFFDGTVFKIDRFLRSLFALILSLSIFINAWQAFAFNRLRGSEDYEVGLFIRKLEDFILKRSKETDFSYRLIWSEYDRDVYMSIGELGKSRMIRRFLSECLFGHYIHPEPKYFLIYSKNDGVVPFKSREEGLEYLHKRLNVSIE